MTTHHDPGAVPGRRGVLWVTVVLRLGVLLGAAWCARLAERHTDKDFYFSNWKTCTEAGCLGRGSMLALVALVGMVLVVSFVTDVLAAAPHGRPAAAATGRRLLFALQPVTMLMCVVWAFTTSWLVDNTVNALLLPLPCLAILVSAADPAVRRCLRPRRAVAATVVALPSALLFWAYVLGANGIGRMGATFPGRPVWIGAFWAGLVVLPVGMPMLAVRWAERGAPSPGAPRQENTRAQ